MNDKHQLSRRQALGTMAGVGALSAYSVATAGASVFASTPSENIGRTQLNSLERQVNRAISNGTADSCIFIWLGGGACHIDTFDPKVVGDPTQGSRQPGSAYPSIQTAIPEVRVCEHLPQLADRLDRGAILRSVHHDVIDEHAAATNRVHVGRPPTGTTIYPSIGSVVAQQLSDDVLEVPPYILMGYPSATRGPGFLGGRYGYIYLTDTNAGPAGLKRANDISPNRRQRRESLLNQFAQEYRDGQDENRQIREYIEASETALRLSSEEFMSVFDLTTESSSKRQAYGDEFGQRCLLARRLTQAGVKFTEVAFNLNFINGTGWDTHNQGQEQQHVLIEQLDSAMAALIDDLEQNQRLDQTLIVIATEFGRPPEFDGGGGRGHQSKAFSIALFGGGLQTGQVVGATDDFGREIIDTPVSIPDLHATIYHALGIDTETILYDGDRPVPITDGGQPIACLFS